MVVLGGGVDRAADAVEIANTVPHGTWSGMPNGLADGGVNGGWGPWGPLDANLGIRPTENFGGLAQWGLSDVKLNNTCEYDSKKQVVM